MHSQITAMKMLQSAIRLYQPPTGYSCQTNGIAQQIGYTNWVYPSDKRYTRKKPVLPTGYSCHTNGIAQQIGYTNCVYLSDKRYTRKKPGIPTGYSCQTIGIPSTNRVYQLGIRVRQTVYPQETGYTNWVFLSDKRYTRKKPGIPTRC